MPMQKGCRRSLVNMHLDHDDPGYPDAFAGVLQRVLVGLSTDPSHMHNNVRAEPVLICRKAKSQVQVAQKHVKLTELADWHTSIACADAIWNRSAYETPSYLSAIVLSSSQATGRPAAKNF